MHFSEEPLSSFYITAYHSGQICMGHQDYQESLILAPPHPPRPWRPQRPEDITEDDILALLVENRPAILVVGTGHRSLLPSQRWLGHAALAGVGLEIMDSGAACRTFNLLWFEGRRVVAALLMP